jgi:hypothetical protein
MKTPLPNLKEFGQYRPYIGAVHKHSTNSSICGEIGVLPNRHVLIRARVSGTNLCANINC